MAIPRRIRKPKRISATVPARVYEALERMSLEQGRSISNMTAFALEYFVETQERSANAVPMQQPSSPKCQGHEYWAS